MVAICSNRGTDSLHRRATDHLFLMTGVRMHRWSALVEIVKSFNERGSPRLAFACVVLFVLLSLGVVGLALLAGVPALSRGLATML